MNILLVETQNPISLAKKINNLIIDDKDIKSSYKKILNKYKWKEIKLFMENEYNTQ